MKKWFIQKTKYKNNYIIIQENQIKSIASVRELKNARLVASAPDLLEACELAAQYASENDEVSLLDILNQAINKTKGV